LEYLPENDRNRFTICPEARKEILKRLLKLNHELRTIENGNNPNPDKKLSKKSKYVKENTSSTLF
jgi:hypothetical protein